MLGCWARVCAGAQGEDKAGEELQRYGAVWLRGAAVALGEKPEVWGLYTGVTKRRSHICEEEGEDG